MKDGNKSLADKIMKEIEDEQIKPQGKEYFIKKQIFLWLTVAFSAFIGGHSLGVLIYFLTDFEFSLISIFL